MNRGKLWGIKPDLQIIKELIMSYIPVRKNEVANYPFPLNDPPPFHVKLLEYGERPYWTPDGKRIAFIESNYGDVCEVDLETKKVKNLTRCLGEHHSFLRVLIMHTGDYILVGPAQFKDRYISRKIESELWFMDKDAKKPPVQLGRRIFEGCGISRIANRITYAVNGEEDPCVGRPDQFEARVADIVIDHDGAHLENERVLYKAENGFEPEPQDFRFNDTEIIMAEYYNPKDESKRLYENYCTVKGINIETGKVKLYIYEPGTHNECEGIFPHDENYTCLESTAKDLKFGKMPTDLWKLKLDGSGQRVRITRMIDRPPWRATNSNISPNGKWLAFMLNIHGSEAGYGMGLGLIDMEAWEKSDYAKQWEVPERKI